MNSFTAADTLYSIFDFLSKDNIMLSEVIKYGVQFDSTSILPNLNLMKNGMMPIKIMKQ
jgi:hypothetical protein